MLVSKIVVHHTKLIDIPLNYSYAYLERGCIPASLQNTSIRIAFRFYTRKQRVIIIINTFAIKFWSIRNRSDAKFINTHMFRYMLVYSSWSSQGCGKLTQFEVMFESMSSGFVL